MNGFDLFVLVVALAFCLLGVFRGLLRLALSIGGLVAGLVLAIRWEEAATPYVRRLLDSELWAPMLAFVGIVVAVVVASVVASIFLHRFLKVAHLAWLDRVLGAAAGLLAAIFLCAAIAVFLASGLPADSRLLADSALAPVTLRVSRAIVRLAPEKLRAKFEEGVRRLDPAR